MLNINLRAVKTKRGCEPVFRRIELTGVPRENDSVRLEDADGQPIFFSVRKVIWNGGGGVIVNVEADDLRDESLDSAGFEPQP